MNFLFVQGSQFGVGLSQVDQKHVGKERLKMVDADGRVFEEQTAIFAIISHDQRCMVSNWRV